MSVKKVLPLIGVGSAAAFIGFLASRRSVSSPSPSPGSRQQRPSGISLRSGSSDERPAGPSSLPPEFWDAPPASAYAEDAARSSGFVEEPRVAADDSLGADWLARATQASAAGDAEEDDPAEIAADSLSMISDASRHAAASAADDDEPASERL